MAEAEGPAEAAGDGMATEDKGGMRPVPTLQELYRTALRRGAPLRVVDLQVRGNARTKDYVIERELLPALEAENLEELMAALIQASRGLEELEVFEDADIEAMEAPRGGAPGAADGVAVVVDVQEKSPFSLNVGTYVQGQEGSVEGRGTVRNFFGHAEALEVEGVVGASTFSTFTLKASQPRPFHSDWGASASLFNHNQNNEKASSHTEILRGLNLSAADASGRHTVGMDVSWREITLKRDSLASDAIRRIAGHELKPSLKYSFFDDLLLPNGNGTATGLAWRASTEVAGIGLNPHLSSFVKQEVDVRWSHPLSHALEGLTLNFGLKAGVMLPWPRRGWGAGRASSSVSDRFYLGGAGNLRGFSAKGVGPTDARRGKGAPGRDALGGDMSYAAFGSLSFRLPVPPPLAPLNLHGHVWANQGNCGALPAAGSVRGDLTRFYDGSRLSAGVGVYLATAIGRAEVNWCHVLKREPHDRCVAKRGLQFGLTPALGAF